MATWLMATSSKLSMERRFQLIRDRDQATILRGRWGAQISLNLPNKT